MPRWSRKHGRGSRHRRSAPSFKLEWTDTYGVYHERVLQTRKVAEEAKELFTEAGFLVNMQEL